MRPQSAVENGIAIQQQVLRCDRRGNSLARGPHELRGSARRDVLEHDLETGDTIHDATEHFLDEGLFPIEHVDLRFGDLTVHLQDETRLGHRFECRPDLLDRGHACIGVRRRTRRVELCTDYKTALLRRKYFFRRGAVRQVERHQRLETQPGGQRSENSRAVFAECRRGRHRRLQVRHHDGARKLSGRERQHRRQVLAIPQVQVPVVGTTQRQRCGFGMGQARACRRWLSPAASPSKCTA